jgi:hypothetical protein
VSNHWCVRLRLKDAARRSGAVGKMNFVWGKCAWNDSKVGDVGCVRSGPANFSAVEPRPWRTIRVVLCVAFGANMRGGG